MIPTYCPGTMPYTKDEIKRLEEGKPIQETVKIKCVHCGTIHTISKSIDRGHYRKCMIFTDKGTIGCRGNIYK